MVTGGSRRATLVSTGDPGASINVQVIPTMRGVTKRFFGVGATAVGLDRRASRCGLRSGVPGYMGEAEATGESLGDEGGSGGRKASPGSPTGAVHG